MIGTIARKELVETLRDGRFRWTAGVLVVLLIASLLTGVAGVRDTRSAVAAAVASEGETWVEQGDRNPHSAAHFGRFAFKPTPMLAYVDRGLDPYLGASVWLEAHWQNPFGLRPAEDRTALQRFGDLSAGFVLQILVPLFVILLSFSVFAGERESGTLRLVLAAGAKPLHLALGKSLGLTAALSFVLVPAALGAVLLFSVGFPGDGARDQVVRGLTLGGVYLVYMLAFVAASVAVSAWAKMSRTAVSVLLCFWVATTLIVPRLAADFAERLHPTPAPSEFYAGIAEAEATGLEGDVSSEERRAQLREDVLLEYGAASVDELPVDFGAISLQASEEYSNKVYDHFFGELWATYAAQERVHRLAAFASPLLAARSISMDLAGTGLQGHRHFAEAAETHRREFVKYLNEDMRDNAAGESFSYLAGREVWRQAPPFEYELPRLEAAIASSRTALIVLFLWLAASLLVAGVFCGRLSVGAAT